MDNTELINQIREKECSSHIAMYSNESLYHEGSWLSRPIKTIQELFPHFQNHSELNILDLGCGVGRNCISIARHFTGIPCFIDCVDILDFAIEKLTYYAEKYQVSRCIHGIIQPIESYRIPSDHYDWIIAVSALEHVDSFGHFTDKLHEIKNGIRKNGIVCLVINSNVKEHNKGTGAAAPAQFEVNLSTEEVENLLTHIFSDWNILKSTVRKQRYDIPREDAIYELTTNVVTFVAKK